MRDDLHKKAPISSALRRVLRHCLLPADRLRPEMLSDMAVPALQRELTAQMTAGLLSLLRRETKEASLFPPISVDPRQLSRLEADVIAFRELAPERSIPEVLTRAAREHIESLCRESEAGMLAGGGKRSAVAPAIDAFRSALTGACDLAVSRCLEQPRDAMPDHHVTLGEALPIGPSARKSEPTQ